MCTVCSDNTAAREERELLQEVGSVAGRDNHVGVHGIALKRGGSCSLPRATEPVEFAAPTVGGARLRASATARPGAYVIPMSARATTHVVRVEFVDPDGARAHVTGWRTPARQRRRRATAAAA